MDRDAQAAIDIELYTPERQAEFILSSAIDEQDYQAARETVRLLGIDPDRIEHYRPALGSEAIRKPAKPLLHSDF